ncbi:MAG: serine/threonine protein kinase [Labilithrix sp.]|nr:serine/threonine protein kinase [Labilithrix sp.]
MPCEVLSSEHLEELEERRPYRETHASLQTGMRLGRYELLAPVATGGMATVWAARLLGHHGFSKLVAIKTILPHLACERQFERMFLEEARIASNIHHPNVCDIYEFGEDQGILYLAMEWVGGDSLSHILGRGTKNATPIDVRIAARIFADACGGLAAAHDLVDADGRPLDIVHRDISPQNVLVNENGVVKLADFGVAKALGESSEKTVGQLKGKLSYMAPEYIEGEKVDRRIDVYAMGVVLYEATLARLPFVGERESALMEAILRGAPPKPSEVAVSYPRELEAIVLRAMARDPRGRFADAEQLGIALEEWLARSGPPVMQSAVARMVTGRVGLRIEDRRLHLKQTMRSLDEPGPASHERPSIQSGAFVRAAPEAIEPVIHSAPPASLSPWVRGAPSTPPPPPAFEAPPQSFTPAPAQATPPRKNGAPELVFVAVSIAMFIALGVIGTQVLRRSTQSEPAAAGRAFEAPPPAAQPVVAPTMIELPDDPPPAPASASTSASAEGPDAVPVMSAGDLPNAQPAPAMNPVMRRVVSESVPPNPY